MEEEAEMQPLGRMRKVRRVGEVLSLSSESKNSYVNAPKSRLARRVCKPKTAAEMR